ncbi:MAG: transposase, partial [Acidimicrobiales bacterium]
EIVELDTVVVGLCATINPALLGAYGVGPEVAATLLVVAGDNPERMHSEQAFASLCGAAPIEASSGQITRHRLNRGGNRQGNNALWRIAMVRMSTDQRTKTYVAKRTREGKTKAEIIRCLKRFIAREMHALLTKDHTSITGTALRQARQHAGLSLAQAAASLDTWPIRISRLERQLTHDNDLAHRYQQWLNQQAA